MRFPYFYIELQGWTSFLGKQAKLHTIQYVQKGKISFFQLSTFPLNTFFPSKFKGILQDLLDW